MHLIWHRTELRTHDQPALHAAATMARESATKVLPLVIIDDQIFARPDLTPRRRAWFLEHTRALRRSYRDLGSDLFVRQGDIGNALEALIGEAKKAGQPLTHAHFVRNYTPYAKERDAQATAIFERHGIKVLSYGGQYTHEPGSIPTNEGKRYGVFGAYRKKWQTLETPEIYDRPESLPPLPSKLRIGEIPKSKSDITLPEVGEAAALARLQWFVENAEADYARTRNEPGREAATSKLSYYFNIGALSPRLAMHRAQTYKWKFELTWWDFFADVLDRLPESATLEARPEWRGFPWRYDEGDIERWKNGQTGYPYIDAGMRELNETGFMHNNVRMYTASFLTKHLLIDWKIGEEIFRGLLLCGDRAQNVGNWQWIAGSGVDAAPFFRIYNPVTQGQKRDPKGAYTRRWIPELRDVPDEHLHTPWLAPKPPKAYPAPMIELSEGRDRFLEVARARFKKKTD